MSILNKIRPEEQGFSGRLSGNGHLSYKTNAAVLIYGRKVVLW